MVSVVARNIFFFKYGFRRFLVLFVFLYFVYGFRPLQDLGFLSDGNRNKNHQDVSVTD